MGEAIRTQFAIFHSERLDLHSTYTGTTKYKERVCKATTPTTTTTTTITTTKTATTTTTATHKHRVQRRRTSLPLHTPPPPLDGVATRAACTRPCCS